MNKKVVIQLIIIIGAFTGAGIVLYNGLFKDNSSPVNVVENLSAGSNEKILPYGSKFDFNTDFFKRNFKFNSISYPQVDSQNEVGIPEQSLIAPLEIIK